VRKQYPSRPAFGICKHLTPALILAVILGLPALANPACAGGAGPAVELDARGYFKPVELAAFPDYAVECENDPQHHVVLHIKPGEKTVTLIPDMGKGDIKSFPITDNRIAVTETYNRFGNKQLIWRIMMLRFNSDGRIRYLSNGNDTYLPDISRYVEADDRLQRAYNCVPMATE
jgi:hypothetical protein